MKLIIYLASHDPNAKSNFVRLWDERSNTIGLDSKYYNIHKEKDGAVEFSEKNVVNAFANIALEMKENVQIELIAHAKNTAEILSSPKGEWGKDKSNHFNAIRPQELKDFFSAHASEDGQYKFDQLTLFCCTSTKFGEELSQIMPTIKITCFEQFIRVHHDGVAYPYDVVERESSTGRKVKMILPVDKDGELIPLDQQRKTTSPHYSAPLHVFLAGVKEIINENKIAKPDIVHEVETLAADRPMVLRGNPYERFRSQSVDSYFHIERKTSGSTGFSQSIDIQQSEQKDDEPSSPRPRR